MKGSSQQKVIVVDASAVVVVVNPQHENFVCLLFVRKAQIWLDVQMKVTGELLEILNAVLWL